MCQVFIPKRNITLRAFPGQTIFDVLRKHDVPIGSSCGGKAVCVKCKVQVLDGMDHLDTPGREEAQVLAAYSFADNERLACQARINGDITISTLYW